MQKDETGEGLLKMDDIRAVFVEFCGASMALEGDIDSLLARCNVLVSKKGRVKLQ